jgi:hypothetical protein
MQGDRKMSVDNVPLPGMANDSSAALLTAVVEAVEWKHPTELPTGKRPGQHVIVYPPELDRLQAVLSSERNAWDVAEGQEEACERIVSARDNFEHPPIFFSTDQEELKQYVDPAKIDEWMTTASEIAAGSRRQVPENGPDVMNSESDSDNEQHGDMIMNGYVGISANSNSDPTGSEHHMTTSQAEQPGGTAKESGQRRIGPSAQYGEPEGAIRESTGAGGTKEWAHCEDQK